MTSPTLVSTIPAAVGVLQGYMTTVAQQQSQLAAGVYVGLQSGNLQNNFMMVGSLEEGALIAPDTYSWAAVPGAAMLRNEAYALEVTIRAWSGESNQATLDVINAAFTMLNGIHSAVAADPGGSGALTPSGSWGDMDASMTACGPLGAQGWGVILSVQLHVINAQLTTAGSY